MNLLKSKLVENREKGLTESHLWLKLEDISVVRPFHRNSCNLGPDKNPLLSVSIPVDNWPVLYYCQTTNARLPR